MTITSGMLPPTVPLLFVANSGSATPAANILNVLGSGGITVSGAGNTLTITLTGVGPDVQTLTGNSGGAIGPTANNINTIGTGSITVVGNPGTSTLTAQLTGLTNNAILYGLGTPTIGLAGPSNNSVLTTNATGVPTLISLLDGQVIIGSTIGAPLAANITGSGGITISNGHNTIQISNTNGNPIVSFIPNSGTNPVVPSASGQVSIVGTGSLTTVGSLNTLSLEFTGLTNHAVLVAGASGTTALTSIAPTANTGAILQNNSGADPSYSTATYPSTTTINQILYSSAANVVSGLATANNGVLTTGTSGIPVITALASNGQLIIGSGSGAPAAATLTAGTGITITNAANSITIAATSGGFTWNDVSGAFSPLKENGYFVTATATGTLPASPAQGDTIKFFVDTTQILTIQAAGTQIIRLGSLVSSAGGTAVSSLQGDSVELVYRASDTCWCAIAGFTGIWTMA